MRSSGNQRMGAVEWSLLVLLAALWGGSFFFNEIALIGVRPFTLVLARVLIAAVALNIIVLATGNRMPGSLKMWGSFLVMGLINNLIPFSLLSWGQIRISASLASILIATTPVWTVILANFLTKDERMTPNRLVGVLFGLAGVVVMVGLDTLGGLGDNVIAQLAVIGAAVMYAFAGIYGKRFAGIEPIVTATGQITGTAVMMVPIVLLVDRPWHLPFPGLNVWAALLGLGLLGTALAYVIYFRLLRSAGATNSLLVTFLVPVSAIILGTLFLDEQLNMRQIAGMVLISLGLMAIDGRLLEKFRTSLSKRVDTRSSQSIE